MVNCNLSNLLWSGGQLCDGSCQLGRWGHLVADCATVPHNHVRMQGCITAGPSLTTRQNLCGFKACGHGNVYLYSCMLPLVGKLLLHGGINSTGCSEHAAGRQTPSSVFYIL
jgi:hypothetical protein